MPNRLANETSPYLLQHKDNPVDWYPWNDEAFEKAKKEDKPVFLSVGYSSCHWCHVMEHESFEDDEIAKLLNENFVSVKVDREERPDIDEAYMTAVQLSTGRGGWPMNVFLTPDKKPFFGGTYFPKDDRGQHPGFKSVLAQVADIWSTKRTEINSAADEFAKVVNEALTREVPAAEAKLDTKLFEEAIKALHASFDYEEGGFGEPPKFPPHTTIEFLMSYAMREAISDDTRATALGMAFGTLEKMAMGGLHDHVGGGFHRYSTDAQWLVPHFEKMLYDNALLLGNYFRAASIARQAGLPHERFFQYAAERIVEFVHREMSAPEGYFYSALDADTEGEEGKFYVWSSDEVREVLGDRAEAFLKAYGFADDGNYTDEATQQKTGLNIPHLTGAPEEDFQEELEKLRQAREKRPRPGLDTKGIVAWNGLMIGALAEAGAISLAERAAKVILEAEKKHGELPHQLSKDKASGKAFLDDYAYYVNALYLLAATKAFLAEYQKHTGRQLSADSGEDATYWAGEARRLNSIMIEKFYDEATGGFFGTSEEHEELFGRSKPVFDQPMPSANAIAIRCLLIDKQADKAEKSVAGLLGWMQHAPQATEALLLTSLSMVEDNAEPSIESVAAPVVTADGAAKPAMGEVVATLSEREPKAGKDGWAETDLLIKLPEGVHINTNEPPTKWLSPTTVSVQPLEHKVEFPKSDDDSYKGSVVIKLKLKLPDGESGAEFEARIGYQPCTDSECLEPTEKVLDGVVVKG